MHRIQQNRTPVLGGYCRSLSVLVAVLLLFTGCAPTFTYSRGNLNVRTDSETITSSVDASMPRCVVVTFWSYSEVNEAKGDIVVHKVDILEEEQVPVQFPITPYWVVWTPVLGTQHLAPKPGILLFEESHPPTWVIGKTKDLLCCAKPVTHHDFSVVLGHSEPQPLDYGAKHLLEKFVRRKERLAGKVNASRDLTASDKEMVARKLDMIECMYARELAEQR